METTLPTGWQFTESRREADELLDGRRKVHLHAVTLQDAAGEFVGAISWEPETGEIMEFIVQPHHQRRGYGTLIYRHAQEITGGALRHSEHRTPDGQAWALSLGEPLPKWRLI